MDLIPAKTLVTRTKDNAWFGTRYTMNIYKGCSHGCIYCDSRSSCYQIEDFDKVRAKANALEIVRSQLKGRMEKGVIGTGAMSDPYNPFEKKYQFTRGALELIDRYRFGVAIATKSNLIERDIDLLKKINEHSPVIVKITVTTSDDSISQIIEPHVCPSSKRLAAIKKLADAGIFCGLLMMPILPYIEDSKENITTIVQLAKENGARFIYPAIGMSLRNGQREYYYDALDKYYPGLRGKYERLYGDQYQCVSPEMKELWQVFTSECKKQDILYKMADITSAYQAGFWGEKQLSLFE